MFETFTSRYRGELAKNLALLRSERKHQEARDLLTSERTSITYSLTRNIHRNRIRLIHGNFQEGLEQNVYEEDEYYNFYRSNEYLKDLSSIIENKRGVGIVVGPDQGLDLFIMSNLDELFLIDIGPNTNLITRRYLEVGSRFKSLFGRYPSTQEYITLFSPDHTELIHDLLSLPSSQYNFSQQDLTWLSEQDDERFIKYLYQKRKYYLEDSWIGSDDNLARTIKAYDNGKIHIIKGNIIGEVIFDVKKYIGNQKQVSLIYTSNADIKNDFSIQVFQQLPLSQDCQVVCTSQACCKARAPRPLGFEGIFPWTILIFNITNISYWPNPDSTETNKWKETKPGIFLYIGN